MKRESVFPLVIGIVIGLLVMIFWQFTSRLNSASSAILQLEQAAAQNTQTLNQVVSYLNQATGANKAGTAGTAGTGTTGTTGTQAQ